MVFSETGWIMLIMLWLSKSFIYIQIRWYKEGVCCCKAEGQWLHLNWSFLLSIDCWLFFLCAIWNYGYRFLIGVIRRKMLTEECLSRAQAVMGYVYLMLSCFCFYPGSIFGTTFCALCLNCRLSFTSSLVFNLHVLHVVSDSNT